VIIHLVVVSLSAINIGCFIILIGDMRCNRLSKDHLMFITELLVALLHILWRPQSYIK